MGMTIERAVVIGLVAAVGIGCDPKPRDGDDAQDRQGSLECAGDNSAQAGEPEVAPPSDKGIPCELFLYEEPDEGDGIGWTPQECRDNAFSSYSPADICRDTAWDVGNCLDLDCNSESSQCVSGGWGVDLTEHLGMGGATFEGTGSLHACEFDPPLDPFAPFPPLGPFTCHCERTVLCDCECEDCDPG